MSSVVPDQPAHSLFPWGEIAISWSPPAMMVEPSCDMTTVDNSSPEAAGTVQRGSIACPAGIMIANRRRIQRSNTGEQECIPINEPKDRIG
jgi:hypothetical protein